MTSKHTVANLVGFLFPPIFSLSYFSPVQYVRSSIDYLILTILVAFYLMYIYIYIFESSLVFWINQTNLEF